MRLEQNRAYEWVVRVAVPCAAVPAIIVGMLSQWSTITLLGQKPIGAGCETTAQGVWPLPGADIPVTPPPGVQVIEVRDLSTGQTIFGAPQPAPKPPPGTPSPSLPTPGESAPAAPTPPKAKKSSVFVAALAAVAAAVVLIAAAAPREETP